MSRGGIGITAGLVERIYTMLQATSPFRSWKLPDVETVHITVTNSAENAGYHKLEDDGSHHIQVSARLHETLAGLVITVAHEMCHIREVMLGVTRPDVLHSAAFHNAADQVCKIHKWDRKQF